MNSEKFCLKWNDFQVNIAGSLKDLENDFCDVTLASEGGHHIVAHRVILAASSPLLRDMLRKNTYSHPLLYMRKIKTEDLQNIVTFMYHGEVNIFQEDLDNFLSLAEEMELKGLTGTDPPPEEEHQRQMKTKPSIKTIPKSIASTLLEDDKEMLTGLFDDFEEIVSDSSNSKVRAVVPINQSEKFLVSGKEHLNEEVDSLIEKQDGRWTCKVCGKTPARNTHSEIARHVEVHIEGVSHKCNQCETVARSSHALESHVYKFHKV